MSYRGAVCVHPPHWGFPRLAPSRFSTCSHIPCLQQTRRNVLVIFVLLHPGPELSGMFVVTRRKVKRLDDCFEGAWAGIGPDIRFRLAPVWISAFLNHVSIISDAQIPIDGGKAFASFCSMSPHFSSSIKHPLACCTRNERIIQSQWPIARRTMVNLLRVSCG
jgi:hypothetical protein